MQTSHPETQSLDLPYPHSLQLIAHQVACAHVFLLPSTLHPPPSTFHVLCQSAPSSYASAHTLGSSLLYFYQTLGPNSRGPPDTVTHYPPHPHLSMSALSVSYFAVVFLSQTKRKNRNRKRNRNRNTHYKRKQNILHALTYVHATSASACRPIMSRCTTCSLCPYFLHRPIHQSKPHTHPAKHRYNRQRPVLLRIATCE